MPHPFNNCTIYRFLTQLKNVTSEHRKRFLLTVGTVV